VGIPGEAVIQDNKRVREFGWLQAWSQIDYNNDEESRVHYSL